MADPISAATGIIGIVRSIGEILNHVKDKTARNQFQDKLFQLQDEALRLQQENAELRSEVRKLREAASEQVNVEDYKRERNAYWSGGYAYCMRCMEGEHKPRSLIQDNDWGDARCAACNAQFPGVFPAKPRPRSEDEPEWWNPAGR
jgi:hypothetical protein